jgi:coenzyme F420-0:L-glutamate ligase/coenzyme F420-1:gamma-L-glutamate ligase
MMSYSTIKPLLVNRRSIRRYQSIPVPHHMIVELLESAQWAVSAHNRQPWRFVVVQDPAQKEHLALQMGARLRDDLKRDGQASDVIENDVNRSYDRITSAPLIIIVCLSMVDMDVYPDERRAYNEYIMAVQSVACAGQNILLTAHSLGLGACWMCAPLFCPDVVQNALNLPNDWQPQGMITLGYPAQERTSTRKPITDLVLWR